MLSLPPGKTSSGPNKGVKFDLALRSPESKTRRGPRANATGHRSSRARRSRTQSAPWHCLPPQPAAQPSITDRSRAPASQRNSRIRSMR